MFKKKKYITSHEQAHYPMALSSVLFRLRAGIPYAITLSRHWNENADAEKLINKLRENDVVIYDREYISLNMLSSHRKRKIHAVFRLPTGGTFKEIVDFVNSGKNDEIVILERAKRVKMKIRLVRYWIGKNAYYLATTLLDRKKYSIASLKDLYHERWGVEEYFKTFKASMETEKFSSKCTLGVRQELFIASFLYALTQLVAIAGEKRKRAKSRQARPARKAKLKIQRKINLSQSIENVACALVTVCSSNSQEFRMENLKILTEKIECSRVKTRPGRVFERRSRKPVNRWRRNPKKTAKNRKSVELHQKAA